MADVHDTEGSWLLESILVRCARLVNDLSIGGSKSVEASLAPGSGVLFSLTEDSHATISSATVSSAFLTSLGCCSEQSSCNVLLVRFDGFLLGAMSARPSTGIDGFKVLECSFVTRTIASLRGYSLQ